MRKLIALCMVLAISTTALCACSNGEEKTGDTDSTSSESLSQSEETQTETTVPEESATEATVPRDPAISEDSYLSEGGVELYVPDGFDTVIGTTVMGTKGYCGFYKETENGKIYINFNNYLGYNETDDVDLKDLPEITSEKVANGIEEIYGLDVRYSTYLNDSNTEYTIDSEVTETINDMEFFNQKGTLDIDYEEEDGKHELDYTVYYTFHGSYLNPKSPVSLIVFTERNNAETRAELDAIAKEIINKSQWNNEYSPETAVEDSTESEESTEASTETNTESTEAVTSEE